LPRRLEEIEAFLPLKVEFLTTANICVNWMSLLPHFAKISDYY
jgi:hypothetical protein